MVESCVDTDAGNLGATQFKSPAGLVLKSFLYQSKSSGKVTCAHRLARVRNLRWRPAARPTLFHLGSYASYCLYPRVHCTCHPSPEH